MPRKQASGQKHNLFSALAAATAQLAKAAKKQRPSGDDDYEKSKKRARDSNPKQKSTGKTLQKQLPAKLLKKKSGNKSKPAFAGAIKKPHRYHPGTVAL